MAGISVESKAERLSTSDEIAVLPTSFINNGASIFTWDSEQWAMWLKDNYSRLTLPPREHIDDFNAHTKSQIGVMMEQFTEGMNYFTSFSTSYTQLIESGNQGKFRTPELHLANESWMEKHGHNKEDTVFYLASENKVYVNIQKVAENAAKYDYRKFHDHTKLLKNGQEVAYRHAGFVGELILEGIEQMAYADFNQRISAITRPIYLSNYDNFRDFDKNPPIMYSLLAQVAICTDWLDTFYTGREGNVKEDQYQNINDKTALGLILRIYDAWDHLPSQWKKTLNNLKETVCKEYWDSRKRRNISDVTLQKGSRRLN